MRLRRTFFYFSCLKQLDSNRWLFHNEVERLVGINSNNNREHLTYLILCPSIKLFAELHYIHTF